MTKTFALVFGVVFLIIGILGFVMNPILGLFEVDALHNWIHLLTGAAGIIGGLSGDKSAKMYLQVFGVIYAIVAVVGLVSNDRVLGILTANTADDILHVVLAAALLWAGFGKMKPDAFAPPRTA